MKIIAGSSYLKYAEKIADLLAEDLHPVNIKKLSRGEIYVALDESVEDEDVYIIQTMRTNYMNQDLMELFLIADAARRSGASTVNAIVPYFSYARQERKNNNKPEAIAARLTADLLATSGVDRLITTKLYSRPIEGFFSIYLQYIDVIDLFAEKIKAMKLKDPIIVSKDVGEKSLASSLADKLNYPLAIIHSSFVNSIYKEPKIIGDVQSKSCVVVNEILDTAGSVCSFKKLLIDEGANSDVHLVAVHPVLSGPAIDRLVHAEFKSILVGNTLPLPYETPEGLIDILDLSELFYQKFK